MGLFFFLQVGLYCNILSSAQPLLHPTDFVLLNYCCHLSPYITWSLFLFGHWSIGYLGARCTASMCLWDFSFSLHNLFLVSYLCGLRSLLVQFKSCWIYWGSFCDLVYDLFLKMFHVHLRKMCILLLLGGMFCRYLLSPSDLIYCPVSLLPYLFSVWLIYWCEWCIKVS